MQFIPSTWGGRAGTATATAARTPTTSTTRRSPPATISAPATATCRSQADLDRGDPELQPLAGVPAHGPVLVGVLQAAAPTRSRTAPARCPVAERRRSGHARPHAGTRRRRRRRPTPSTGRRPRPTAEARTAPRHDHPGRRRRATPPHAPRPDAHRPRRPTRWTSLRTRAPASSPPPRATRSPRRSPCAEDQPRQAPWRRSGCGSPSSATPTPPSPAARRVTVVTDGAGIAAAPALVAGEKTGDFTVRVTVVGRTVAGLDYTATVTAAPGRHPGPHRRHRADLRPGRRVRRPVEVKATYKGAAARQGRRHRDPDQVRRRRRPRTTRAPTSRTRTARPSAPSRP